MDLSLILALLFPFFHVANGVCPTASWQYESLADFSNYNSVDGDSNAGYLMESPDYHVPVACTCGVLKAWHFYPKSAQALQLQVWEQQSNNLYVLKGENYFTVPASAVDNVVDFEVPIKDRITVRNGYLIGWYGASGGVIGYQNNNDDFPDEQKIKRNMGDLAVGATTDWSDGTVEVFNRRVYAIGATVTANTAPGFTNLPRTVYIYRTTASGSFIYKPKADDIDEDDAPNLIISTDADVSGIYVYNRTTGEVRLGSFTPTVGTTTLTFTVSDQCGNTATADLTITVLNWNPSISSPPTFATIAETTTIEQQLGYISVSDDDDSTFTVNSGPTFSPSTTDLEIKFFGHDDTNRTIITKQGASWNYATAQQYEMDLTLQDPQSVTTNQAHFLLYITKNDPPKFTNLNNAAQANASYLTTAAGDLLYTVSVTDAEDDPLTFTFTCTMCPFTMEGNAIYATEDLIRKYVPGYDATIAVSDGTTTIAQKALTIKIYDINDKPSISNPDLQYPLVVFEGTVLDTVLFTVRYNDVDTDDNHTIQATYSPTWGINYFHMNISTGILTTAHNVIDYEALSTYQVALNITVSDGMDWDSCLLTIDIANVNEAPVFHQTAYRLTPNEEGTYGSSAGDPQIVVNDPDAGDTQRYSMDCGTNSRYFYMDNAGAITYAAVFDLDTSSVTVPYNCTVTVTDGDGLTATTRLEIDIQDINDNAPVFPQGSEYVFVQPHTLGDERFVGQVSASDADKSEKYSKVYYRFSSTPFLKSFLFINDFGNIYVNESWTEPLFDFAKVYTLEVTAENAAENSTYRLSATTTVLLILPGTSTSVSITTDRPLNFTDDTRNVAWLMVAAGLFLALAVAACGFILVYTVQVKRYRWCIPWCRKRLLNLKKLTRRQKRMYYLDILEREELQKQAEEESSSSSSEYDSEEEYWQEFGNAPSMSLWAKRGGEPGVRTQIPRAAQYNEPKPPLKRALSRMLLQKGGPKIFDQ